MHATFDEVNDGIKKVFAYQSSTWGCKKDGTLSQDRDEYKSASGLAEINHASLSKSKERGLPEYSLLAVATPRLPRSTNIGVI